MSASTDETDQINSNVLLSNIDLIRQAEEFTESLELERAVTLYDEGCSRFPNDTIILDAYTDLLL